MTLTGDDELIGGNAQIRIKTKHVTQIYKYMLFNWQNRFYANRFKALPLSKKKNAENLTDSRQTQSLLCPKILIITNRRSTLNGTTEAETQPPGCIDP